MTKTFLDKMIDNEDILNAMMSIPRSRNEQFARMRREENFSFLWEELDMDKIEMLNLINQRELDFVREYSDTEVPDWMLRCEAQDLLLEMMYEQFEEKGLI